MASINRVFLRDPLACAAFERIGVNQQPFRHRTTSWSFTTEKNKMVDCW